MRGIPRNTGAPQLLHSVTGPAHTVTNTWDLPKQALLTKQNQTGQTLVSSYTYTVNALGQRTNPATAGTAFAPPRTTAWGYDVLGQVTSAANDAQSRRIAKTSTINNQQSAISPLYDGWNVIAEYVGSAGLQPALSQTHLWGTYLSGTKQGAGEVGGLLAVQIQNPQSAIYYPTYDGNGNISEYLSQGGTVAVHFKYDPFGRTVANTDSANQFAYRFSTKPLDTKTGLYYYGFRFFDPATGRWASRNPIGERGVFNLYCLLGNDGIDRTDILGLHCRDCMKEFDDAMSIAKSGYKSAIDVAKKEADRQERLINEAAKKCVSGCDILFSWDPTGISAAAYKWNCSGVQGSALLAALATRASAMAYLTQAFAVISAKNLAHFGICKSGYGLDEKKCPCPSK